MSESLNIINKNKHKAGILLPIFSLPSKYGIGSFGKSSYDFVDFLKETKNTFWQVLPLGVTSYGDSPYQAISAYAINPYFIDLDELLFNKLLTSDEIEEAIYKGEKIDYLWLYNTRYKILRLAFNRFTKTKEFDEFKNIKWVKDYAYFMTIKNMHNGESFLKWDNSFKDYNIAIKSISKYQEEIDFYSFIQYIAMNQYKSLKEYANKNGIYIIGDMPIYVSLDSVDVWSNPEMYLLDSNYSPLKKAGVPPDYFSVKGQLWGNPIYNYELMKKDNYKYYIDRVKHNLELFDVLRIDHFRGFSKYYSIDGNKEDATSGEWVNGPGIELFNNINKEIENPSIIAEDLGSLDDESRKLLKDTNYPGMKVLQFAFSDWNNEYLPFNYKNTNSIVYTGTHDNDTSKSFIDSLSDRSLELFNNIVERKENESIYYSFIRLALESISNIAIIPIQDYLEEDALFRINTPSTKENNWIYRLKENYNSIELKTKIKSLIISCNREKCDY